MASVTLSSKNQITIPAGMVRSLGLKAGDKLSMIEVGDHLALFPRPANFTDSIVGSMRGFWGSRTEIDRYVSDLRAGPERDEQREEVEDVLAVDDVARRVVEELSALPQHVATRDQLASRSGAAAGHGVNAPDGTLATALDNALAALVTRGAVRRVQGPSDSAVGKERYRLVREFVQPSQGVSTP